MDRVTFFHKYEHELRPTVSIFPDGTYKEHRSFVKAKKPVINLIATSVSGPTQKQLDRAGQFAGAAIKLDPRRNARV